MRTQIPIKVFYKGEPVGDYIADIVVERILLIELKCCDELSKMHSAQCINYLQATEFPFMLLVNFQNPKVEWRRIVRRQ